MNSLINNLYKKILSPESFLEKMKYNLTYKNISYNTINHNKNTTYKVSVIMPVYNAEDTLNKTIGTIIDQSIGFENIELLIVDDKSSDNSRNIIYNFSKEYNNIIPVFLGENTGSPAEPRNLGIQLAKGKYSIFIDSDDWFDLDGIEALYNILEETNDNYAVGKTIQVDNKGQRIIGEYESHITRKSINPLSIEHIFHHLGPRARMINTNFVRDNNITFPNWKFAEDKSFFMDIILNCDTISTTDKIIYYLNRHNDNNSLTTTTSIFEKTDKNILLINYIINKKLPIEKEKVVLNRLYEFDCITRLFDRHHFLKSDEKNLYFEKFQTIIDTTSKLNYDFTENFFNPWHKTLVDLFHLGRYEDIVKLIEWSKKDSIKELIIENELPYYVLPFDKEFKLARIPILAVFYSTQQTDSCLKLQFNMYGDFINDVETFVLRQKRNGLNQMEFPIIQCDNNLYSVDIPFDNIEKLNSANYSIFLKYLGYRKLSVVMNTRSIIKYNKKKFDFYTTVNDNFGLSIK